MFEITDDAAASVTRKVGTHGENASVRIHAASRDRSLKASGPAFSYTATTPPRRHPLLTLDDDEVIDSDEGIHDSPVVVNVIVTLESSAQWPDNVEAIRKTKTAFLLRLSAALTEHHNVVSAVSRGKPHSWLDICFDGYVFVFG